MLGIFLDLETNGLDFQKNRTLEIAFKMLDVNTKELKAEYSSLVSQPLSVWDQSDLESLQINGLDWPTICKGKKESQIKEEIVHIFTQFNIQRKNSVFICQNPSYDRAFFSQIISSDLQEQLNWPYHWLDLASMFWAKCLQDPENAIPWEIGFSKNKIAKHLHLPPEKDPHRAMNGVNHLLLCYENVVGFPKTTYSNKTAVT